MHLARIIKYIVIIIDNAIGIVVVCNRSLSRSDTDRKNLAMQIYIRNNLACSRYKCLYQFPLASCGIAMVRNQSVSCGNGKRITGDFYFGVAAQTAVKLWWQWNNQNATTGAGAGNRRAIYCILPR